MSFFLAANRTLTPLTSNDNNAFASNSFNMGGLIRRAGPPPGRKVTGQIDVIGSNGLNSRRELDGSLKPTIPSKENVIQVMTAERREYSRVQGKFDTTMPPPPFVVPQEPFFEPEGYNYGYEPTQEQQWNNDQPPGWMPTGIKELTPGHMGQMNVPMGMRPPMGIPQMVPPPHMGGHKMMPPPGGERERDRERDHRERVRERSERSDRTERDRGEREYSERSRGDRVKSEDRFRERSTRREATRDRSRSRGERRRRSKSRDKDRKSRDKKKSHKKDKEVKEERVSD